MYEIVEHSADVKIRVFFKSLQELIDSVTSGYRFLLVENATLSGELIVKRYKFNRESQFYKVVVNYLNELILQFDLKHSIPENCTMIVVNDEIIVDVNFREVRNASVLVNIPKAATYSSLDEKNDQLEITIDV